eukprot:g3242.t1
MSNPEGDELVPPLIMGGIIGLCYIISVGANDVANALGTSVGSGAISLRIAIILGGLFELLGATLVGGKTSSSLGEKFLTIDTFTTVQYSYAMFAALFGSACWNSLATYFSLPVSSTHAIIGSLVFIGIVQDGIYSVNWVEVGLTALSWVLSPLVGFAVSFSLYWMLNRYIISQPSSFKLAAATSPYLNTITITTLGLFIFMAGPKAIRIENAWVLIGVVLLLGVISLLLFKYLILPWMERNGYIKNGISYSGVDDTISTGNGFESMKPVTNHLSSTVSLVKNDSANLMTEALSPNDSATSASSPQQQVSPSEYYFVLPVSAQSHFCLFFFF